jgi:hypothetical protein
MCLKRINTNKLPCSTLLDDSNTQIMSTNGGNSQVGECVGIWEVGEDEVGGVGALEG